MPRTVIADTSCLIVLTNIGELELLRKIYGNIVTTRYVAAEYDEPLPEWIEITPVADSRKQQLLEFQLDPGESSAIALALETPDSTIILDDYKARKIAAQLGLSYTGTIGVIIRAKLRGVIPTVRPLLAKIKQTNFHLSVELEQQALSLSGEWAASGNH